MVKTKFTKSNFLGIFIFLVLVSSPLVLAADIVVQEGDFTINNSNFFVDVSTGRIGIGTTSPVDLLDILASGTSNSNIFLHTASTGATSSDGSNIGVQESTLDFYMTQRENADLVFHVNGGERIRILADGNVGIGTTGPTAKLEINEGVTAPTASGGTPLMIAGTGNTNLAIIADTDKNSRIYFGDSGDEDIGVLDYDNNDNSFRIITNTAEALRIDSSQQVGIGTNNPLKLLHIESANPIFLLKETDGSADENFQLQLTGGDLRFQTQNDAGNGASAKMTIQNDGNVGIGTTIPDETLTVNGKIAVTNANGPILLNTASSDTQPVFIPDQGSQGAGLGGNGATVSLITGGVNALFVATDANIGIGTSSPAFILDILKDQNANTKIKIPKKLLFVNLVFTICY